MSKLRNVFFVSMISFGILGSEMPALCASAIQVSQSAASSAKSPAGTSAGSEATASDPGTAAASVTPATTVEEAHSRWLTGAQVAAQQHGCTYVAVEQQYGESIDDAVKLFGQTALEGSCLLLQPISTSLADGRYSIAWGGTVNGIDIVYISDLSRVRIWNAVAVPVN